MFGSFYGTSNSFSYMSGLGCSGSESRLIDCSYNPIAHTGCGQGQHVGVQCVGMFVHAILYVQLAGSFCWFKFSCSYIIISVEV